MTDHLWNPSEKISGIELAEIEVLILFKEIGKEKFRLVLESKGLETLEELDPLTVRTFLHYLHSL